MITDRQVWIFREERTGSTALTEAIRHLIDRPSVFIEHEKEVKFDPSILINTHNFNILKLVKKEYNPIILRCTRKNRFEQFLSWKTKNLTGFCNIQQTNKQEVKNFKLFLKENKISITYADVLHFVMQKENENLLWNEAASKFDNQVFYYEDLNKSVDIPLLNQYNFNINAKLYTKKIPDYKEDLYTNINEVKYWLAHLNYLQ